MGNGDFESEINLARVGNSVGAATMDVFLFNTSLNKPHEIWSIWIHAQK